MTRYRITVDPFLCQGHGLCIANAPRLFQLHDNPDSPYPQARPVFDDPPEKLLKMAQAAARECPNSAIRITILED
jgi:ferredoxin